MYQYSRIGPSRERQLSTSPARFGRAAATRTTESARVTEREGPTYDELYEEARKRGLKGRSKMSKTELERALGH